MGGAGFSREKFNAREIALSSDEIRGQQLWSRDLQNVLAMGSADVLGVPFSCAMSALSIVPATGFQMTLADGDALFYFPTDPTLTVDDSAFEVVRWRSVPALTFANPDATNPRIDLVVATPAMVDTDLQSRNILVDPGARTIAAQNVNKTSNPSATLAVITGTAAGSPVPPAVPSGKLALFEVLVPAAAPSSATFFGMPRIFRRAPFPLSTMSGILAGCSLRWDLTADPSSTSSALTMVGPSTQLVIDGETIDASSLFGVSVTQDTSNNPFGVAAGASDKPYYIYAVGGRHAPQGTPVTGGMVPVAIVESLTAPNLSNYGKPGSAIATPRGGTTIDGAVYIGLGFVVATTTRRRACTMSDSTTRIVGADIGGTLSLTKTGAGVEALGTLGSRPSISRRVNGLLSLGAASANAEVHMHPDQGDGAAAAPGSVGVGALVVTPAVRMQVAAHSIYASVDFEFNPANAKIWIGGSGLANGDTIGFTANAYDHRVRHIASAASV